MQAIINTTTTPLQMRLVDLLEKNNFDHELTLYLNYLIDFFNKQQDTTDYGLFLRRVYLLLIENIKKYKHPTLALDRFSLIRKNNLLNNYKFRTRSDVDKKLDEMLTKGDDARIPLKV